MGGGRWNFRAAKYLQTIPQKLLFTFHIPPPYLPSFYLPNL